MTEKKIFSDSLTPRVSGFVVNTGAAYNPDPRSKDIAEAHKEGLLLAHMLELHFDKVPTNDMRDMFDVMASRPKAMHRGYGENQYSSTPEGMRGMASTVLAEGQEGNLWCTKSHVGLLFDGRDEANIKLEQFFPFDAQSSARYGNMNYSPVPSNTHE